MASGRSSSSAVLEATCGPTKKCSTWCENWRGDPRPRSSWMRSGWQMSSELVQEYTVVQGRAKSFYERYERKSELQHQTHFCPGCGHGIFHNNASYSMTGGQAAPTTLIGQKSTTTPGGRSAVTEGYPMPVSELLATLQGPVYIERVGLGDNKQIAQANRAVRRGVENQVKG